MRKQPLVRHFGLSAVAAVIAAGIFALPASAAPGGEAGSKRVALTNSAYIVQMADLPVTAYQGGIQGYAATKPRKGQKIDPNAPAVVSYMAYMTAKHDRALASVGASKKHHTYGFTFNGFAADLTPAQAQKLAQQPGVLAVTKDEFRNVDTATTPAFLGLSGPGGVWNSLGATGENVIIGIIDSGVWPEHPSFSDRTGANGNGTQDGKLAYQQIPGWHGKCVPGEAFAASNCNQKLIGARFYNAGFGGNAGIDATLPFEFNSPRDHNGHGTHTATTAGGNADVAASGSTAALGRISGIAPRARIASYKACWSVPGSAGSCTNIDLLAAIDQAVADGVDVINYSISGTQTNFRDPVEIAFLFAANAGIFVAASAGNSGPFSSTVAHPGPWLTTVAAGTHNRDGSGSVSLGNTSTYNGASMATIAGVGPRPLIDSTRAGLPGANPQDVALCLRQGDEYLNADGSVSRTVTAPVLDPVAVAGKIVLCDRGVSARVNKSLAVKEAGGVGMVLVNVTASTINADLHIIPTVHLQNTARADLKAYASTDGATATINRAAVVLTAPSPLTANFSSRGPLFAGRGDLLKPDLIAPGQDILAGVAPPGNGGKLFDLYSGTSMSSPHVAGLAALFKQKYPSWSPMAIKSALMTTGTDVLDGGSPAPNTNPVLIFRQGAGHVSPAAAMNPGLVYDSGYADWLGFLCGTQLPTSFCTSAGVPVIDPSDFNGASIAIGDMAGVQTVKRRVTNVSGSQVTVSASVTGMTGLGVTVTPSSLTLRPGETKPFTVGFANQTATPGSYVGGQLTWTGGGVRVRSPLVVRPVALAAPAQVSDSYGVTFGYTGAFTATARGLVAATVNAGTVADDPSDGACSLTSPNAQKTDVVVPAGTTYARFSLFDTDVNAGSDLDMCVFNGATQVGSSGTGNSDEEVNLTNPPAATYTVVVQGWGVVGSTPFKLHTWLLGSTAAGNLTVSAPASATVSQTGQIAISTSGLTAGTKYLGSVVYGGTTGMPAPTIVRINP